MVICPRCERTLKYLRDGATICGRCRLQKSAPGNMRLTHKRPTGSCQVAVPDLEERIASLMEKADRSAPLFTERR